MENQTVDILVRDLTKVGSIPKSEARRRILELLSSQKQRVMELLPNKRNTDGVQIGHPDLEAVGYNQALSDIKNKIKEEL